MLSARKIRTIKKTSKKQEQKTAKDIGGRAQAASGALPLGGGADVRVQGKYRIECKFTEKDDYVLKFEELRKLKKQAINSLEMPVFQISFPQGGKFVPDHTFAVIESRPENRGPNSRVFIPMGKSVGKSTDGGSYSKQFTLNKYSLDRRLTAETVDFDNRYFICFKIKDKDAFKDHNFEIMHWHNFLSQYIKSKEF